MIQYSFRHCRHCSTIAKEYISRVCEGANTKGVDMRRVVDSGVTGMLGEALVCLRLYDLGNGAGIHQHEMPNITFASGGDSNTMESSGSSSHNRPQAGGDRSQEGAVSKTKRQ